MSQSPFSRYNRLVGRMVGAQDATSRIEEVNRSVDADWLIRVAQAPDMQGTVVKAAQVRLRKLGRGAAV